LTTTLHLTPVDAGDGVGEKGDAGYLLEKKSPFPIHDLALCEKNDPRSRRGLGHLCMITSISTDRCLGGGGLGGRVYNPAFLTIILILNSTFDFDFNSTILQSLSLLYQ
jgi:hypothetical protein